MQWNSRPSPWARSPTSCGGFFRGHAPLRLSNEEAQGGESSGIIDGQNIYRGDFLKLTHQQKHGMIIYENTMFEVVSMGRREFKHITYEQRLRIQELWAEGHSRAEISRILGFNYTSIDRELKRGSVNGTYNADHSQRMYRRHLSAKGPEAIILSEPGLGQYIAKLILEERLSLSQILKRLDYEGSFENYPKSRTALYSAIDNNLIPGVDRDNLKSDETTVFNDGTIHLAKWVRQELSIENGDILRFDIIDGKIVFAKGADKKGG